MTSPQDHHGTTTRLAHHRLARHTASSRTTAELVTPRAASVDPAFVASTSPEPPPRMKPRAVQHALVRMLFDPAYAAAVRGPGPVDGLAADERALLRRVPAEALTTDRHRRARAVHAIVDEYPVSAAALGLAALENFFASSAFHACIARRGAMALAFGTWLEDQAGGPGRIEAAAAVLRRRPPLVPGPLLRCAPHLAPLIVPAGSLAWYEATLTSLGPQPLLALAGAPPRPGAPPHPPRHKALEHLLLEHHPDDTLALGGASEALVRLLRFAERPRSDRALAAEAVVRGAAPAETAELIAGLLADGLLVRSA